MPAPKSLTEALEWRYATKTFDPAKKISGSELNQILEAGRLAPSSFGLQPYHLTVVENPETRQKLKAVSWNQGQVTDASHLIVLRVRANVDRNLVERYMGRVAGTRGVPLEQLAGFQKGILGFLKPDPLVNREWATRQAYLAWGFMLLAASQIGVDSCPIEGLDPAAYDQILGDESLKTAAAMAVGHRAESDANASLKKVRLAPGEFVTRV